MRSSAVCFALLLCSLALPLRAQEAEDHPLLTRYAGSQVISREVEDHARYRLATSADTKAGPAGEALEGRLTRLVYRNPVERSTLEILANYRQALERAGARVLFECALEACGPSYAMSSWNRFNGLFAAADGEPRYVAARLDHDGRSVVVAVMVGRRRTQVDVLELGAMQTDMVVVDAAALGDALTRAGRVEVPGIFFDTDRATLKPESNAALAEIAALLRARAALRVYVVRHTDMIGSLEHNLALSQARARSVVQALTVTHGIEPARLEGHGVGPLAPVAGNSDEGGRARNRRVELVAR
jgi:OOP family OmpA-OmpF porin